MCVLVASSSTWGIMLCAYIWMMNRPLLRRLILFFRLFSAKTLLMVGMVCTCCDDVFAFDFYFALTSTRAMHAGVASSGITNNNNAEQRTGLKNVGRVDCQERCRSQPLICLYLASTRIFCIRHHGRNDTKPFGTCVPKDANPTAVAGGGRVSMGRHLC